MIDRSHDLPITRQARMLNVSRGSVYYLPRSASAADLALMRRIDELHLDINIDAWFRDFLGRNGYRHKILYDDGTEDVWRLALGDAG
jgi:putative transposase